MTIRFQPVGSAPPLRQRVFKISAANRFESVVAFLSRKLRALERADANVGGGFGTGGLGAGEGGLGTGGVFCYVNSVFAPGLDEGVGGLWRVGFSFFFFPFFTWWGGGEDGGVIVRGLESGLTRWLVVFQDG